MLRTLLFLHVLSTPVYTLIGFDCGGRHLNITAVSLLDVGECNLDIPTPNSTTTSIQLLQLSDYSHAEVFQCKVEISRTIFHCGMHSHISAVLNGRADYVHETGYTSCMRMFIDGVLSFGPENIITNLRGNQTAYRSITLAGRIQNDGTCKGAQYSDPYGTWNDVVVQASAKISLKSSFVPVDLNSGKIKLRSGTTCTLSDSFCLDSDDGYSYWKPMPTSSCGFNRYDVLYEGPATKIVTNIDEPHSPIIYSLVTQEITFALTTTKEQPLCGYTLLRTEHPKLFILEVRQRDTFAKRGNIPIHNFDIFTYMNSKFVYVEKHVRSQITTLYHNIMQQKCELERQVLTNTLSFAKLQPDEFAYRLMKSPGYMAVNTGEAIHIIKCIPVEVTLRKTEECFTELPVTARNTSLYLTPKSRVLTKFGNERECSNELPTLYRIESTWIQFTPRPQVLNIPPQQLQPMVKLSWKYAIPGPLAISGIYSETDIEKLRNHIMFPAEKPALLNEVARRITGYPISANGVSVYNLLDEASLNKIVESATSRVWRGFVNFGSATAGVMGIFIIIRVIKLIIDTAIHGYALHTVYGCSLHLIGAIWSSLTHLLIHLARSPTKGNDEQPAGFYSKAVAATAPADNTPIASNSHQLYEPAHQEDSTKRPVIVNINTSDTNPYNAVRDRLDDLEPIPTKPSGFVLK